MASSGSTVSVGAGGPLVPAGIGRGTFQNQLGLLVPATCQLGSWHQISRSDAQAGGEGAGSCAGGYPGPLLNGALSDPPFTRARKSAFPLPRPASVKLPNKPFRLPFRNSRRDPEVYCN